LERQFTDSTHPTDAQTDLNIGWDGDTSVFAGYIAEILVYDRVLTGDEVNAVNEYLATKYSLQSACASFIQPETPTFDYDERYIHMDPVDETLPDTGSESGAMALIASLFLAAGCLARFLRHRTNTADSL